MALDKIEKGSHGHHLLEFLYFNRNKWVQVSALYSKKKGEGIFPYKLRSHPDNLLRRGLIDRTVEKNRASIRINESGIALYEEMGKTRNTQPTKEKKNPTSVSAPETPKPLVTAPAPTPAPKPEPKLIPEPKTIEEISPRDLYRIKEVLTKESKELLKVLLLKKVFNSSKSKTRDTLQKLTNLHEDHLGHSLRQLITNQLIIKTYQNGYYLTINGIKIAESLMLKGLEFTEDSMEAYILNPIGRKVLHLVKRGVTVSLIAEKIGYNVEKIFIPDIPRLEDENKYAKHKVFQCLDRLAKFNLIELSYHPTTEGSTKITKIMNYSTLEMIQWLAIFVELIPTLLVEDNECKSVLRKLLNHAYMKEKFKIFDEVQIPNLPYDLRGKISNVEKLAHWLFNIEEIVASSKSWKNLILKENGGKHYFMLKKKHKQI